MGNLRYIFMLIVSLFNQRIQYFQKLNKINSRSWTMKRRLQEGRDRGVIHIQSLGENSVAGVTVQRSYSEGQRRTQKISLPRERVHRAHVLGSTSQHTCIPPSPRCDPSTPLFLLAGERAPRHLESRRDLIFIRLISFVLSSTGGNNRGFSYRRPENMNFHFNFRLTVPSPRRPLSRKFIF